MALNNELKSLINDMAQTVLQLYNIPIPITNIDAAVKKMGGYIIENPSINRFSDGRIRKAGDNTFSIEISPFQTEERRNFAIAQELGHLFLHMGFKNNIDKWRAQDHTPYYRNGNPELEYQANEFAAAFLMPQSKYKEIMDKNTDGTLVDTSKVAEYFHVSIDTAANRGKWLGYLEW